MAGGNGPRGGLDNPAPGSNWVSEYQIAGLPFLDNGSLTTAPLLVTFPAVTQTFTVYNAGPDDLWVGFSAQGVTGSNHFVVPATSTQEFPVRTKQVYLMADTVADYSLFASLTGVTSFPALTGSLSDVLSGVG